MGTSKTGSMDKIGPVLRVEKKILRGGDRL